jgi:uncharacterized protein (TIGR01244 family)
MKRVFLLLVIVAIGVSVAAAQSQVKKEEVAGIRNLARIETTVACAGAITVQAIPEIKKMGFASIINLRLPTEPGADVEAMAAEARRVGINYTNIPYNNAAPDPATFDRFIQAITRPGQEPAFIHCAGGGRAATTWFVKRVLVDKWDVARAEAEATALGMTNPAQKEFALKYIQSKR